MQLYIIGYTWGFVYIEPMILDYSKCDTSNPIDFINANLKYIVFNRRFLKSMSYYRKIIESKYEIIKR